MPTQDYSTYGTGSVVVATQSAIVGAGGTGYVDLTGCSATLTPGLWLVYSHFESARFWNNFGAGGSAHGYYLHSIWKSDNSIEYARKPGVIPMLTASDRYEVPGYVQAILDLSVSTTVKLRGILHHSGGSNFATGYRYDSALYGTQAKLVAVKLR